MIKNTVSSLAMLTSINKTYKKDYVDNFVPFIATLIKKKNYTTIENNVVCRDFKEEYGLSIPYHPMQTILTRAKKKGIIKREHKKITPITEKVSEYEFSRTAKEQIRQQEKLIGEIISYANDTHSYKISPKRTEDALISFLKKYDLDILFISEADGVLPDVHPSKQDKFIIYSFIKKAYESDPVIFDFVVNIAVGNLIANFILYENPVKIIGKFKRVCFYLDAPIIFRLTGFDGEEIAEAYNEFLNILEKEGACIKVFRHTYEEVFDILENCVRWIQNPLYDPSMSSATTRYFKQKNYTKLDVKLRINNVRNILQEYLKDEKNIVETPTVKERIEFQESEKKIRELIVNEYNKTGYFTEAKRDLTIDRDKDSISLIYILREGKTVKYLKNAKHIFLTTNATLAFTSSKYERERAEDPHTIPTCLTDTFVGTSIWLQSPAKLFNLNRRKIIADCYAALQPSPELLKKYVAEINKLKEEDGIDENSYYLLRSDGLALNLLEEKTLGDADSFDSSTLLDIHNEIKSEMQKDASQKYVEEKGEHRKTRAKFDNLQKDHKRLTSSIENRATKIAKLISNFLLIILIVIFVVGVSLQIVPSLLQKSPQIRNILIIIYSLIMFLNIFYGFNLFGFKGWVQKRIKEFIIKKLT